MKFVELLRYRHYKVRSIALNITSFGFNVTVIFIYCLDFWSLGDNEQKRCPGGRQIFWEQIKEAFQIFFQEINEDKNWTLREERERESAFFCNVLSDKIQNNSLCQGLGFWEIVLLYFLWAVCNLQAKLQNNSEIG